MHLQPKSSAFATQKQWFFFIKKMLLWCLYDGNEEEKQTFSR